MRVLDGFSLLVICLDIVKTFFFESFSLHSAQFYSWLVILSLRNERLDFFFHDLRPIVRIRHE